MQSTKQLRIAIWCLLLCCFIMNTAFMVILLILFADHSGDGELFLGSLLCLAPYIAVIICLYISERKDNEDAALTVYLRTELSRTKMYAQNIQKELESGKIEEKVKEKVMLEMTARIVLLEDKLRNLERQLEDKKL